MGKHKQVLLALSALLGFLGVLLGALTDHLFAKSLSISQLHAVGVALKYLQQYSILLVVLSFASWIFPSRLLPWLTGLFLLAVSLFSFGIIIGNVAHKPALLYLAPIGGSLLMVAWLVLACLSLTRVFKK